MTEEQKKLLAEIEEAWIEDQPLAEYQLASLFDRGGLAGRHRFALGYQAALRRNKDAH